MFREKLRTAEQRRRRGFRALLTSRIAGYAGSGYFPSTSMGRLQNVQSGITFELLVETTIGRGPGSDLTLQSVCASKSHALVRWASGAFIVRDKGSTNGTRLNHTRLVEGQEPALAVGDLLEFGGKPEAWRCIDVAPPTGLPVLATERLRHSLAECVLHVGPPNVVHLIAGGLPQRIALSPGEYDAVRGLAQQRLQDRAQGVSREGWVIRKDFGDEICGSVLTLNQHIKRMRDKIRDLDVLAEDATRIIEQAEGEIRLGVANVRVD